MGQNCVVSQVPEEYNHKRPLYTKSIRKSRSKPSVEVGAEVDEPTVGESVRAIERELGEYKLSDSRKYKRGVAGKATLMDKEGTIYAGEYIEGAPGGYGRLYLPTGMVFTGTFKEGVPDGEGRMVTENGVYYQGEV